VILFTGQGAGSALAHPVNHRKSWLALALRFRLKGSNLVTKRDMAISIAEKTGSAPVRTLESIQQVFDGIIDTLVQEGRVELRGFGVFEVKRRQPRQARNRRTGEPVGVPERLAVTFKAGQEVQERLNQQIGHAGNEPSNRPAGES
jgi:integration host factor subunit beta